jgi:hypothetical protein
MARRYGDRSLAVLNKTDIYRAKPDLPAVVKLTVIGHRAGAAAQVVEQLKVPGTKINLRPGRDKPVLRAICLAPPIGTGTPAGE